MEEWRRNLALFYLLIAPAVIWLALFFIIPMGYMVVLSLSQSVGPTETVYTGSLDAYRQIFQRGENGNFLFLQIIGSSLVIAALTTLVCLIIGYPVAIAITFAPPKWRPILLLLVILPFWTNLLIRTYALMAVFRTSGVLNQSLEFIWTHSPLVFFGEFQPLNLLYNQGAIIAGLVYIHLPFMVLPLYTALEKLDRSYLEASLDLGAGQWRTFWRVMVPLTMPAIIVGCMITFIPAFGALVTPNLLGGPDNQMVGNLIEQQFKSANNWPFGAALSLLLVYITFILLALQSLFASRRTRLEATRP